jgi:hypothetical protein
MVKYDRRKGVMSMAEKEIVNRTKNEIAAGGDNIPPQEPKIYESGYFFLSQQINDLRDRMDAKFDKVDEKFDSMRKETDARFDKLNDKFDYLQRWPFALIVTVVLGFVAIYFK